MDTSNPLYQLAIELETRSAAYYKAATELRDLGKLLISVQGQPALLRDMIDTTTARLAEYKAALPVDKEVKS